MRACRERCGVVWGRGVCKCMGWGGGEKYLNFPDSIRD